MTSTEEPVRWTWSNCVLCAVVSAFIVSILWLAPLLAHGLMPIWEQHVFLAVWGWYLLVALVAVSAVAVKASERRMVFAVLTGVLMALFSAPLPFAVGVLIGFQPEMPPFSMLAKDFLGYAAVSVALGLASSAYVGALCRRGMRARKRAEDGHVHDDPRIDPAAGRG